MVKTVLPFWLEPHFGMDKSLEECETLFLSSFTPIQRVSESALFSSKWFDYRRLHPLQADYYLAECYRQKAQSWIRKTEDYKSKKLGLKRDFLESREAVSINQLRRLADSIGVEYKAFLGALEVGLRVMGKLEGKYYPRPSLFVYLAQDKEVLNLIKTDFWQGDETYYAKDPFFQSGQFISDPSQIFYEDYLCGRIHTQVTPFQKAMLLKTSMYKNNTIRLTRALQEFGLGVVKEAQM